MQKVNKLLEVKSRSIPNLYERNDNLMIKNPSIDNSN